MSSNSTLVRAARSALREQPVAQVLIPAVEFQFPARVATTARGDFVVGSEVPAEALEGHRVQLHFAQARGGRMAVQGSLVASRALDDNDYFTPLHGASDSLALLEPDVVIWDQRGGDQFALYGEEWTYAGAWSAENHEAVTAHLNDRHLDLLVAIASGAPVRRVVSIDPDGMLLENLDGLSHLLFPSAVVSPEAALDAIAVLIHGALSEPGRTRLYRA